MRPAQACRSTRTPGWAATAASWRPSLGAHQRATYRFHLADELEQAYGAVYVNSKEKEIIQVLAIRFRDPGLATDFRKDLLHAGRDVAQVSGGTGSCHASVLAHVSRLFAGR